MKTPARIVLSLFLIPAINSAAQNPYKLEQDAVEQEKIEFAEAFAVAYFEAAKEGRSYQFTDDATDDLKNQLTPEIQNNAYNQIQALFGDYESLEYAETWGIKEDPGLHIIRFRSVFSQTDQNVEVRVVLNEESKIAGFFITPWSDTLD